jgi:phosphatidylinositol transfer protein SFH5
VQADSSLDYEGVGWNSRDANSKAAASEISSIFSSHYPEFLVRYFTFLFVQFAILSIITFFFQAHKLFVNVPRTLTWIFWIFKPLLPAATLAKMKVAGHGAHGIGKELLPLVDADQLPKQYGGKADAPF